MSRAVLLVGSLSIACASQEAPSREATPPPPTAKEAAVPDGPWIWRATDDAATTGTLLGVVGQQGIPHCPDGGYEATWLNVHPTIGRVSLSGPPDSVFEEVMDQPVLALGVAAPSPESEPLEVSPTPCLPAQMRSDWRRTPRGTLVERSPAPDIAHFRVAAVRPLHELTARADGDHVVVELRNPVSAALRDVELRVHYEGCFGKPGTTVETTQIGELAVGAVISARAPQLTGRDDAPKGRDRFRAFSVQLVATGDDVTVDLDVDLSSLGVPVKCPR